MARVRSLFLVAFLVLSAAPILAQHSYPLGFQAADVAFDHARGHLYASVLAEKKLVRVESRTGIVLRTWVFDVPPESLTITPDGRWLYVALLTIGHNPSLPAGGRIAELDLASGELTRQFPINLDPWDIVATDSGFLVVAAGTGQWTVIRSYRLDTTASVGSAPIRHRSFIALHPSQTRVYAANTDLSPSDIECFALNPTTGALTWRGDSIYHGDHPMGGRVHVNPEGTFLVTRGGGLYRCTEDRTTDMRWVRNLVGGTVATAGSDAADHGFLCAGTGMLDYYNSQSLELVERRMLSPTPEHVSAHGPDLFLVDVLAGSSVVTIESNPAFASEGNTPPSAAFDTGLEPLRPGTPVKFDAEATSDAQDRLDQLLFRWDFDGDGQFDTAFSSDPLRTRAYPVAGTKYVTLQVKDRFGLVDQVTRRVDLGIVPTLSPPFAPRALFEVQFSAADVLFDRWRPQVYMTSRERKLLVRVERWSGLVSREWNLPYPAESMAMTPSGSRLYVALLSQGHQGTAFGDHTGQIAEIDPSTGELLRIFTINEDPWDLVATDTGYLVVSSGSGQWDEIRSYRLSTTANTGSALIRHFSNLALHPSQTRVYAADTDVGPSDIERFDLNPVTGALTARGNSPYHGEHPMQGNVHVLAGGTRLLTRGGGVYASTETFATDMVHQATLTGGASAFAASPDGATFVRAHLLTPTVSLHSSDLSLVRDVPLSSGPVLYLHHEGARVLAVTREPLRTLVSQFNVVPFKRP